MKAWLHLFAACICVFDASGQSTDITTAANDVVLFMATHSVPLKLTSAKIGGARITSSQKLTDSALEGVILLIGAPDQDDFLELLWWKHPNRSVRLLLVAAFMCATTEDVDSRPNFESSANEFAELQASQRLEEVHFVQSHLSAVRGPPGETDAKRPSFERSS
jgi:hypothetical protein